jgi:hypothetical protein
MTATVPNATANTESSDLDGTLSRLRRECGASKLNGDFSRRRFHTTRRFCCW